MRFTWYGDWNQGKLTIESDDLEDLRGILSGLREIGELNESVATSEESTKHGDVPTIEGNLGCSDAINAALESPWGREHPRTMAEIMGVLETNGLFFSKGSMSGSLNSKLRRNVLKRRKATSGLWEYSLR